MTIASISFGYPLPQFERNHAAEAAADDREAVDARGFGDGEHVLREPFARDQRWIGIDERSVPAKFDRDGAKVAAERIELRVPNRRRRADAVHEDQRRSGCAGMARAGSGTPFDGDFHGLDHASAFPVSRQRTQERRQAAVR